MSLAFKIFLGEFGFKSGDYEIVYPIKVREDGNFVSHFIPHYFKMKRNADSNDKLHYVLSNSEKSYLIELTPNINLLSPGMVTEIHRGNVIKKRSFQKSPKNQCFYRGKIKGVDNSYVALTTCHGLVCMQKLTTLSYNF